MRWHGGGATILQRLARLPDVLPGPAAALARDHRPRLLTSIEGPLRTAFSGTTWYFAEAALAHGVIDAAIAMTTGSNRRNNRIYATAAAWKATRILRRRKFGGYKFHPQFHDVLWSQYSRSVAESTVINQFQLYGPHFRSHHEQLGIVPYFHIDGTLREYFSTYLTADDPLITSIGDDVRRRAIDEEQAGYTIARGIIAMSRATQRCLREDYGVAPGRIAFIMPGANLPDDAVLPPSPHSGWLGDAFTVGFVGFYPLRKGLRTLAQAVRILRERRVPIRLRVIGRCPDDVAAMDGVDYLGTINKATDTARFVEAIRGVDLGCQLSRAELVGIAMLEFLRVGVPFLATDIGGMPDVAAGGGGVIVSPSISAEELADTLSGLMNDTAR
ncbi:MAG: glycosyltransferase family 4 protein, partial [Rhodopila sp.]